MGYEHGDRVTVGPLGGAPATVQVVNGNAYGVVLAGREASGVQKWFVEDELEELAPDAAPVMQGWERAGRVKLARPVARLRAGHTEWYRIQALASGAAEIAIYDEIGYFGVTARNFIDDLNAVKADTITLRLNSPGGEVFDGVAIYNALAAHPARIEVQIDSLAASIASVIAMAGDTITMSAAAAMMIHDGFAMCVGNAADMQQTAQLLDKTSGNIAEIYAARTGRPAGEWRAAMRAETWYSADEAVAAGLADAVTPRKGKPVDVAAEWDLTIFSGGLRTPTNADESSWDGAAAMSKAANADDPAAAYKAICAGRRAGDPDKQASWALPHHPEPGAAPNAAGVRNALSRLPQTQGLTNEAAAKAHLEAHMSAIQSGSADTAHDHTHLDIRSDWDTVVSSLLTKEAAQ